MEKDEDIQHNYNRFLFPLLFIKWKFDSLMNDYNKKEICILLIHWILVLQQRLFVVILANLISGFLTAVVLVGNHENEKIFNKNCELDFIEHQIAATRNYKFYDFISLIFMGGMQFQTEHHFFPQIPFYYLSSARKIIVEELKKYNLSITEGSIW